MKIAISTDAGNVSAHFGRCEEYTIVEIENGKILSRNVIPNPGHQPSFLPGYLANLGVECIIAGGAGMRARSLFEESGIKMLLGIQGTIDDTIQRLCEGTLEGGENLCAPGSGKRSEIEESNCEHHKDKDGGSE